MHVSCLGCGDDRLVVRLLIVFFIEFVCMSLGRMRYAVYIGPPNDPKRLRYVICDVHLLYLQRILLRTEAAVVPPMNGSQLLI